VTVNVRFLMLIEPLRVLPELAATEYDTDALPLDVEPAVTVTQLELLTAFQGHPAAAATPPLPSAAALVRFVFAGAIPSTAQKDWLRTRAIPPMVIVADRGVTSKLGATKILTEPFPPLAPPSTLAQVLSEVAVHEHPGAAETETLYTPPAGPADRVSGLAVTVHD
jgi:hypothetical protein